MGDFFHEIHALRVRNTTITYASLLNLISEETSSKKEHFGFTGDIFYVIIKNVISRSLRMTEDGVPFYWGKFEYFPTFKKNNFNFKLCLKTRRYI